MYKSSYVLKSVSIHWMYQNVLIGSFFNVQINNALFEFLFVMLNQKLDFSFFESFIYNKIDVFALFTSFNFHSGLFP